MSFKQGKSFNAMVALSIVLRYPSGSLSCSKLTSLTFSPVMWFVGVSTRGWEVSSWFSMEHIQEFEPRPPQKKQHVHLGFAINLWWKPINWNYAFHDVIPKFPLKILRFSPPSRVRTPQVSPSFKPRPWGFLSKHQVVEDGGQPQDVIISKVDRFCPKKFPPKKSES